MSAKEHISDGPEGIILESMLEGYAEFYSADLSEKIHRGQKENALKGKNNGGGIPLGYLLDKQTQKLMIDPETAPLVVEIFERYSEGATVRSIIEDFNSRGLTTKRGKPFNTNSFNALLKKASTLENTVIRMWSFPTAFLLSCRRICSTVFNSEWRKINALPQWRKRMKIFF